ncbi:MAG TPA: hypothetical protein VH540_25940 [Ktedonobacterales bacterium]
MGTDSFWAPSAPWWMVPRHTACRAARSPGHRLPFCLRVLGSVPRQGRRGYPSKQGHGKQQAPVASPGAGAIAQFSRDR